MQDRGCLPGLVLFLDNEDQRVVQTALEVRHSESKAEREGDGERECVCVGGGRDSSDKEGGKR